MKKIFLLVVTVLIAVATIFVACKKTNEPSINNNLKNLRFFKKPITGALSKDDDNYTIDFKYGFKDTAVTSTDTIVQISDDGNKIRTLSVLNKKICDKYYRYILSEFNLETGTNLGESIISDKPIDSKINLFSLGDIYQSKIYTLNSLLNNSNTSNIKTEVFYMLDNVAYMPNTPVSSLIAINDNCLYMVEITYDLNTGEILSEDIIGVVFCASGGDDGGGNNGGGGSPNPPNAPCPSIDDVMGTLSVDGDPAVIEGYNHVRPTTRIKTCTWPVAESRAYKVFSVEQGSQIFNNSLNQWEWTTFSHINLYTTGVTALFNSTATPTLIAATPTVATLYSGMQVSFTVTCTMICASAFTKTEGPFTCGGIFKAN